MKNTKKFISSERTRILVLPLLIFALILALPCSARAQKATIKDLFVNNSDTHLLLYLSVRDCFTPEMETGIQNGIPATFTYFVDLYKIRKAWPDQKLASHVFHHTLTYDNLKEEYTVLFSPNNKKLITKSREEAKMLMSEIDGFRIIKMSRLTPDESYIVKVKAKLAKKTLPLYFHYLIPFSSLWDFETDWYTLKFRY